MVDLDTLLQELAEKEGSDLHLKVGEPPIYRIDGKLVRSEYSVLKPEDTRDLIFPIMTDIQKKKFMDEWELDISYELNHLARFRINVFLQKGNVGVAIRMIPIHIKTIDDWGLPQVLKKIALLPRGFVLITGPTGSGKSTTLAAVIQYMNSNVKRHIITVEDPIEFVFQDAMCTIEQREVGVDTLSFSESLKRVVRQNPDVIMVGEMRDLDTISRAITAAEMGSLVLATLHTTDAAQTIDRMIDVFSPEQQHQIRLQVSTTLQAIVSQTLLPLTSGKGRVAAFEILVVTPGVRNTIREGKVDQIYNLIQSGGKYGMKLLDATLKELYLRGLVNYEDVLAKASNPQEFESSLARV